MSLVDRTNLANEIYQQIRRGIVNGQLRAGHQLPPSRELARRLGVSRTTVMVAYERLGGEGLVTARVGAGTFVGDHLVGGSSPPARAGGSLRPRPVWDAVPLPTAFVAPAEFDFRTGLPDISLFPYAAWRRLVAHALGASAAGCRAYGDPAGDHGLRQAVARHVSVARGLAATAEDITITSGTQQALDLVARALLAPGDRVAVEDPGYEPIRRLFQSLDLEVSGIPVDDQGLVIEALPRSARLVYLTPSHQYPLGCALSLRRRTALLAWAQKNDAAIVEDDYDSEFRYSGRPLEPLHTLDTAGRVLYVGSFSKTMLPTLRLGFVVSPPALGRAIQAAKYVADWHTALPTQLALARFIDQGGYGRHLRRMRPIYRARHERIVNALARGLGDGLGKDLTALPSEAGLHIAVAADGASLAEVDAVADRAGAAGVAVQKLSSFYFDHPARPGLVLGYGAIPDTDIDEGLRRLTRCFDDPDAH